MNFNYRVRNRDGVETKGLIAAKTKDEAVELLQSKGYIVLKVDPEATWGLKKLNEINIGGIPMNDKVIFMRQLSTMVSAGIPLTQALEILQKQATNPLFIKVLKEVVDRVRGGSSLAMAFRRQEKVFDDITVNLIEAGEESGHLEEVLLRLAVELEDSKKLQDKVQGAFIYPVVIGIVVLVVLILLMVVLVPAMRDIYSEFGADLPFITRLMIWMSDFVLKYWWLLLLIVLVAIVMLKLHYDSPDGKKFYHRMVLKAPIFGSLMVKIQTAQFTRVLALLLKSGVSVNHALELAANSLSNLVFRDVVSEARNEVEKGTSLAIPIARSPHFPLIVSQMIAVGEEAGELDMVLDKMAQYYNSEVEVITSNVSTLLEPVILVVLGVMIGFIALAVYMPMFGLAGAFGG